MVVKAGGRGNLERVGEAAGVVGEPGPKEVGEGEEGLGMGGVGEEVGEEELEETTEEMRRASVEALWVVETRERVVKLASETRRDSVTILNAQGLTETSLRIAASVQNLFLTSSRRSFVVRGRQSARAT